MQNMIKIKCEKVLEVLLKIKKEHFKLQWQVCDESILNESHCLSCLIDLVKGKSNNIVAFSEIPMKEIFKNEPVFVVWLEHFINENPDAHEGWIYKNTVLKMLEEIEKSLE